MGEFNNLILYASGRTPERIFQEISKKDVVSINNPCFMGTRFGDDNYSHFTLQCLGALLLAKKREILGKNIKILISRTRPFHDALLKIHSLEDFNFLSLSKKNIYKFTSLFYVDNYFYYTLMGNTFMHPAYVELYEEAVDRYGDEPSGILGLRGALKKFPSIAAACGDAGYKGTFVDDAKEEFGVEVDIMEQEEQKTWQILPKRLIVERTFAWFGNYCRLSKHHEVMTSFEVEFIQIANIHTLLKILSGMK